MAFLQNVTMGVAIIFIVYMAFKPIIDPAIEWVQEELK